MDLVEAWVREGHVEGVVGLVSDSWMDSEVDSEIDVEEALEEMLLTSAVPVALVECDEVISKVGGQTMSFINRIIL